jgi:hypothetical protein
MKVKDWADEGWLDFESRMLEGDETSSQVRLLKAAWLHGARHAIDQAVSVVSDSAPTAIEESSAVLNDIDA